VYAKYQIILLYMNPELFNSQPFIVEHESPEMKKAREIMNMRDNSGQYSLHDVILALGSKIIIMPPELVKDFVSLQQTINSTFSHDYINVFRLETKTEATARRQLEHDSAGEEIMILLGLTNSLKSGSNVIITEDTWECGIFAIPQTLFPNSHITFIVPSEKVLIKERIPKDLEIFEYTTSQQ